MTAAEAVNGRREPGTQEWPLWAFLTVAVACTSDRLGSIASVRAYCKRVR